MSFSIAGKTAIVTGAASGTGLAIARHFVTQGANVVFADADEAGLEAAVADLGGGAEDTALRAMPVDLRARLSITNLVSATLEAFDRIDILVNAAREVEPSDLLEPEADQVLPMLQANLLGPLRLSQAVARRMIARAAETDAAGAGALPAPVAGAEAGPAPPASAGAIVNLSSIAGARIFRGQTGFSIATAALDQMTRSLAVALAPHGVRVNGLAFASLQSAVLSRQMRQQPGLWQAVLQATPLGRIAAPAELAHAAQFLASEASGFMTGQVITVDGGRSLLDNVRLGGADSLG